MTEANQTTRLSEERLRKKLDGLLLEKYEPIAIIGMGLRAPGGVSNPEAFAKFLREKGDGIVEIPSSRWDNAPLFDQAGSPGTIRTNHGGFLDDIHTFDAKFFNISPKEADFVDPQQRLILETAWEALEQAQLDVEALKGRDGGVYIGSSGHDYFLGLMDLAFEEMVSPSGTGTASSAICGRLSYFLGWRGPSVNFDTACSSSLVALQAAVQGLRRRDCSIALCGGVQVNHHPAHMVVITQANMISGDGRCKTFDDKADGYGRSEGCGVLLLKRLSDALRDKNHVFALISGTAVGHSGESGGLTVPNRTSQEQVMRRAIESAALEPKDIGCVEAHGTGTSLGDPIEAAAIDAVFHASHSALRPVRVASVKSNIGHSEGAAGVLGVIKAALQVSGSEVFPHTGMETPSRSIPWDSYVLRVPTEHEPWSEASRHCLVNSFGFAGTIASAVVSHAPLPAPQNSQASASPILTLSAKTPSALRERARQLQEWLEAQPELDLAAVAHASSVGRTHFGQRVATPIEDRAKLLAWLTKQASAAEPSKAAAATGGARVAFLFTGQGSQYVGMGRELYQSTPLFRQAIDECDRLFQTWLGRSIKAIMFGSVESAAELIEQTQYTQCALFSLEYALAQYWLALGVEPQIVLGHSIGEIVAAQVAGLFTLEDAVRLVAVRGRLMQSVKARGGMLAISLPEAEVAPWVQDYPGLGFAAVNAPNQCVVSGDLAQLEQLEKSLSARQIDARRLPVSHAFHSQHMAEVVEQFKAELSDLSFGALQIPLVSNVTGRVASSEELASLDYWAQHICEPVLFARGVTSLAARGQHVCLEIGPSPALSKLGKRTASEQTWLASLAPKSPEQPKLAAALAALYGAGVSIDWSRYHQGSRYPRVELPLYPFERRHHWLPKSQRLKPAASSRAHSLLGELSADSKDVLEFRQRINASQPEYLSSHRIMDQVVFPAAGFIETLIALQWELFGETGGAIEDIEILEPLYLDETDRDYVTRARPRLDGAYDVEIVTRRQLAQEALETLFVRARVRPAAGDADTGVDLEAFAGAVREESLVTLLDEEIYPPFEAAGLLYGDDFQRLTSVRTDELGVALGVLSPEPVRKHEFVNPAVLDSAFQSVAFIAPQGGQAYLPARFASVRFFKQPRGALRSVLRGISVDHSDIVADLLILDGTRPVCLVRGMTLRAVDLPSQARGRTLQYRFAWHELPRPELAAPAASSVLVVGVSTQQQAALQRDTTRVRCAADWAEAKALLDADAALQHLVYRWQASASEPSWRHNYEQLLELVRKVDDANSAGRDLRIWFVTEHAQLVSDAEAEAALASDPTAASLWGFGHTVFNEYPRSRATLIDVDGLLDSPEAWNAVLREIQGEAAAAPETMLAFRAGRRYVRRWEAHDPSLPAPKHHAELQDFDYSRGISGVELAPAPRCPFALSADKSYAVTGAFGGLGLAVVEKLAERGARHIAMLGRRVPGADELRRIEAKLPPGSVLYPFAVDVSSAAQVDAAFAKLAERAPELAGVYHCAGVLADAPLSHQSLALFEKTFLPKVDGTIHLLRALDRQKSAAYVVGFSSVTGALGARGQANYAAANTCMDHILACHRALGRHCLSLAWGPWAEVGMVARGSYERGRRIEDKGVKLLRPKDGLRAMFRRLPHPGAYAAICEFIWPVYMTDLAKSALFSSLDVRPATATDQELDLEALSTAPRDERIQKVTDVVRALTARFLGFGSAEEVEPDARLVDLGMDSLVAVELKNALESLTRIALPKGLAFKYPTIPAVAEFIVTSLWPEPTLPEPPVSHSRKRSSVELAALA
jgi:acyl transferase domain-containing protein